VRQLVLATRRQGWRGLVGRANGGMIVHLGVIVIAVAFAASNSYTRNAELTLERGVPVAFADHTFTLGEVENFTTDRASGVKAEVSIDGGQAYSPAITRYTNFGIDVGTPSVKTSLKRDIYLTLSPGAQPGDSTVRVRVFIKPLISWLWIGGGMMVVGTLLSAFPGKRRRRPTDPVSAPAVTSGEPASDAPVVPEVAHV
jgi:cytochrome c-type biogenesis protein CcmF